MASLTFFDYLRFKTPGPLLQAMALRGANALHVCHTLLRARQPADTR